MMLHPSRRLILVSLSRVLLMLLVLLPILFSLLLVSLPLFMLSRLLDRFSTVCMLTSSTVLLCLSIWKSSLGSGLLSSTPVLTLNLSSSSLFSPILPPWPSLTTMLHSPRLLSSGICQNFGECPFYLVSFLLSVPGLLLLPCSHTTTHPNPRILNKVLMVVLFRTLVSVMKFSSSRFLCLKIGSSLSLVPTVLSGAVFHLGNSLELSLSSISLPPSSAFSVGSLVA